MSINGTALKRAIRLADDGLPEPAMAEALISIAASLETIAAAVAERGEV